MKFILQIIFWGIIGYFLNQVYGLNGILGVIAIVIFGNIITYDDQMKKLKKK